MRQQLRPFLNFRRASSNTVVAGAATLMPIVLRTSGSGQMVESRQAQIDQRQLTRFVWL